MLPSPPLASIKRRNPDADEMLPLIDSSVFFAIIVVVVVLMDEFLFIFFETAVTIIIAIQLVDEKTWRGQLNGGKNRFCSPSPYASVAVCGLEMCGMNWLFLWKITAINTNAPSLLFDCSIAGNFRSIRSTFCNMLWIELNVESFIDLGWKKWFSNGSSLLASRLLRFSGKLHSC